MKDPDKMTPLELRIAVVKEVFGDKKIRMGWWTEMFEGERAFGGYGKKCTKPLDIMKPTLEPTIITDEVDCNGKKYHWHLLCPDYTSDPAAIWTVIEKMMDRFQGYNLCLNCLGELFSAEFDAGWIPEDTDFYASDCSLSVAICRAALKAVRLKEKP